MRKLIKARKFLWGRALLAKGFMWQYICSHLVRNEKLREKISYRSLVVSVGGANLLTDGWAFPGLKSHRCTGKSKKN